MVGFPGNSIFTDTLISIENLIGTAGNDIIIGSTANNSLTGGDGNDSIYGGNGDDYLEGGNGNDFIDGGFGFDTINGGAGVDTTSYAFFAGPITANLATGVVGFPGNSIFTDTLVSIENLIGAAGNDIIIGSTANNSLTGGGGDDYLTGGRGNDVLFGGVGADKFIFNSLSEGIDTIKDFQWTQNDKILVSKVGFGASSLNQFSYNSITGELFFQSSKFATITNNPVGFNTSLDIVLV